MKSILFWRDKGNLPVSLQSFERVKTLFLYFNGEQKTGKTNVSNIHLPVTAFNKRKIQRENNLLLVLQTFFQQDKFLLQHDKESIP